MISYLEQYLDDLENCLKKDTVPHKEVAKSITVPERKLCNIMKRIQFRGKWLKGCHATDTKHVIEHPNTINRVGSILE